MKKLSAPKSRLLYFVLTVAMLVISAGAPMAGGGIIESIGRGLGF